MENLNLPVGAIDKIYIAEDTNIHYGYSEDSDVVGKVHKGEEYFVYKEIDGWLLLGNNQWISFDKVEEPVYEEVEKPFDIPEVEVVEDEIVDEEIEKPTLFSKIKKIFTK
jgi:hypothetical protein